MASRNRENGQTGVFSGSPITALLLVVPGIALYVYILYIMIAKLVYPASFLPFTNQSGSSADPEGYSIGKEFFNVDLIYVVKKWPLCCLVSLAARNA